MAILDDRRPRSLTAPVVPSLPLSQSLRVRYNAGRDVLFITAAPGKPAVSHDLNDEIWARFVPATGEVVGFEIEDFVSDFLPRHSQLQKLWRQAQAYSRLPPARRWARQRFIRALIDYAIGLLAKEPVQFPFPPPPA